MGTFKKISKYRPSLFQGKLEFSAVAQNTTLAIEHPYESAALRGLVLGLALLCVAYAYFVGASVINIIERKEMSAETTRLQTAIATMEREYFALSHGIDESLALAAGLTPVEDTQYVYRPGNAAAATIAGNGI